MERSVWFRWINLGLFLIPVILFREPLELGEGPLVLILAALTLIPLSSFLESAVEELEELFGQFIGGLLHTTFGNAAELAIALTLLLSPTSDQNSSQIVLSSVAGVVIRNSLLILGVATVAGAFKNGRMKFSPENAGEYSSFFALAVTGLCLPTAAFFVAKTNDPAFDPADLKVFGQYSVSLCVGVALLVAYIAYILFAVFRLRAGENLVEKAQARREAKLRQKSQKIGQPSLVGMGVNPLDPLPGVEALFSDERRQAEAELAARTGRLASLTAVAVADKEPELRMTPKARYAEEKRRARKVKAAARAAERGVEEAEEEAEGFLHQHKWLRIALALVILALAATGVVFMSEAFAGSVKNIGEQYKINGFFLGLILIPVVGGAVELYGAMGMARRNLIEITMGVTAGASIQMVTVVVPVLVIVGYLTNHPLLLNFNPLEVIIFVAGSFLFMLLSRDGEATILEGVQLCSLWALLAATAYFLPPPLVG